MPESDATRCIRTPTSGRTTRPQVTGYEILEELGRGGMGVVYKAWQHSLQRAVALKMIIAGSFAADEELARFRSEAMSVARLHHPNLLSIYEIGESNGLPFYAMEYMEGGSLARRLNGQPVAPHTAAALVRSLAHAMDYAHKNGIVHRDLKPANILLAGSPSTPIEECVAKVTDFGIAKHLHQDASQTRTGDILGTPHYMAPEQAIGRPGEIGPAADVYSLGAILYELLTGRTPFHGLDGAAVLVKLTREDPEPPSYFVRSVSRDLQTICLKCLEKDPTKRYASAASLAEDLTRYLDNEPIHAKPASLTDRTLKWVRRRPAIASVLFMTAGILVLGFSMMAMMWRQAVDHARKQDELLTETKVLLADAYLDRGIHLAEKGDVRRGMHWMLRSLETTIDLDSTRKEKSDLSNIIRMNLASWGECVTSREVLLPHTDWVWDLAFTPDQQFVATASKDKEVKIWSTQTGQLASPPLVHQHAVWGIAFSPDGKTLFTISGDYSRSHEGELCVWSADPTRPGHFVPRGERLVLPIALMRLCVNPVADRVCVASKYGDARLYAFDATAEGNGLRLLTSFDEPAKDPRGESATGQQIAAFSPDGATLATIAGKRMILPPYFDPSESVHLWDARTGRALGEPLSNPGLVRALAFSKNSKHLIVGASSAPSKNQSETSFVQTWNVAERKRVATSTQIAGRIKTATVADNGQFFAVSIFEYTRTKEEKPRLQVTDGHVLVWQLHEDGAFERYGNPLRTHHVVWSMEFSPDSRMLLAGCENGNAYLWSISTGQRLRQPILHEGNSLKVAFSKDGRLALTASAGAGVNVSARLWEVPSYRHMGPPLPQPSGIAGTSWANDGEHVWIACERTASRWHPFLGVMKEQYSLPKEAHWFFFTKDDYRMIAHCHDGLLREFDVRTDQSKQLMRANEQGRGVFVDYHAATDLVLKAWLKPSRFELSRSDGTEARPSVVAEEYEMIARKLTPKGDLLAVSQTAMMRSNRLLLYDTKDMKLRRELTLDHAIKGLGFSPDGRILAMGGRDRQVQRLDVETGKWIGSPLLHDSVVTYVGFLGNDRLLATCNERGQILLWDAPTGKRIGPAFDHPSDLVDITIHPSGKYLLTSTHNKLAVAWRVPEPIEGSLERLRLWVETMTGMEMKAHDNIVPISAERLMEKRRALAGMGGAPR